MSDFHQFSSELMSLLEQREARLQGWGFYDTAFTVEEVEGILTDARDERLRASWEELQSQGWSMAAVLDEMAHANLLHIADPLAPAYRTRFAEGVRLFARLRQMFNDGDWMTGANLVGDLKLHLSSRRYPRRDQAPGACLDDLRPHFVNPSLQEAAFRALATDDMSGFQRRAFARLLPQYNSNRTAGTVISAGTGAGKTKAFYIPALLGAITELGDKPFTKILAIYPRNVLLADQFREAVAQAQRLAPVLRQHRQRPLRLGALLGPTAESDWFTADSEGKFKARKRQWRRVQSGWVVPFLVSPRDGQSSLVWRDSDRLSGRTSLYRADAPDQLEVEDGCLALTREQIRQHPPDVLFVSLEMLNREMGNPQFARAFGLDPQVPHVRMLLLDEVHAHEGVQGAQTAWVLRRWRFWAGHRPLHVVGLSATLHDAPRHVALVSQVPAAEVQEIRPDPATEMVSEAAQYTLLLKADAGARTSLLSTTIQAGMLLSRLLTPRNAPASPPEAPIRTEALFGRKLFAFTDNLDVVNRWYSDLYDAELLGRLAQYRLHPEHRQPPAHMSVTELDHRNREGQIWDLPRLIGHNLSMPVQLGRCSSQDPGADAGADLVVATASLEVGYDDPAVGATLHHKRPMSMSSFIQRRGRAGRTRGSRPWTVVVLSDYGGDRWAFQNAERLFEPEIDAIRLPLLNPYVVRVQSAYFLLDWLGRRVGRGGPFYFLSGPWDRAALDAAADLLRDLLGVGQEFQEFRGELRRFLTQAVDGAHAVLGDADVDDVLWNEPRPLLRQVIPTLLRKLEARWALANPSRPREREDEGTYRPIPRFIPKATFSELNIAEVRIDLDDPAGDDEETYLPVAHALAETCPGRVSKRYALGETERGLWSIASGALLAEPGPRAAADLYPECLHVATVGAVNVYQPLAVSLVHRPANVGDGSNATWHWQSSFTPFGTSMGMQEAIPSSWRDVFSSCDAFLHRDRSGVSIVRFAQSCTYEISVVRQGTQRGEVALQRDGDAGPIDEAVGFRVEVDALRVRISGEHLARVPEIGAQDLQRHRTEFFRQRVRLSRVLAARLNVFAAEWMWQLSMAMLASVAVRENLTLRDAQSRLHDRAAAANEVLRTVLRHAGADNDGHAGEPRLHGDLRSWWGDPVLVEEMARLEADLWDPPADEFADFLRRRHAATLAQAFRAAAVAGLRDVSEDDLHLDLDWLEGGDVDVYLSEQTSGGIGQIEAVVGQLRTSPSRFGSALEHALRWCGREEIGGALLDILRDAVARPRGPLGAAFEATRSANTFAAMDNARQDLHDALESTGMPATRDVVVGAAVRLLAPGSTPDVDRATDELNRAWQRITGEMGAAIDARTFSYLAVTHPPLRAAAAALAAPAGGTAALSTAQLAALVERALVPRCPDSCRGCLLHETRFGELFPPSRSLAAAWLMRSVLELAAGDGWQQAAVDELQRQGPVRIRIADGDLAIVLRQLQALLARHLDADGILVPIHVARVARREADWLIELRSPESEHA